MLCRLAVLEDAHELKRLNDLFNGDNCNGLEKIAASLENNQQEIVCVLENEALLIGFCCAQIFKSMCYDVNYGEITELFILESFRHKGLGKKLLAFTEEALMKQEIKGFQLFTGQENNAAQQFYRTCGYKETSEMMFRKRL